MDVTHHVTHWNSAASVPFHHSETHFTECRKGCILIVMSITHRPVHFCQYTGGRIFAVLMRSAHQATEIFAEGLRPMKTGYPGLFIPGPTNIPERGSPSDRDPAGEPAGSRFPRLHAGPFFAGFENGVQDRDGGQVFMFPGSGTGGWEAAIANTLSPGDKGARAGVRPILAAVGRSVRARPGRRGRSRSNGEKANRSRHCGARSQGRQRRTRSRRCWSATTRRRPA